MQCICYCYHSLKMHQQNNITGISLTADQTEILQEVMEQEATARVRCQMKCCRQQAAHLQQTSFTLPFCWQAHKIRSQRLTKWWKWCYLLHCFFFVFKSKDSSITVSKTETTVTVICDMNKKQPKNPPGLKISIQYQHWRAVSFNFLYYDIQ